MRAQNRFTVGECNKKGWETPALGIQTVDENQGYEGAAQTEVLAPLLTVAGQLVSLAALSNRDSHPHLPFLIS